MTTAFNSQHDNALLECSNLSFAYQNQSILNNISFAIPNKQFVGLIGSNGAGKSTLLRCLYRYLSPTAGDIYFDQQLLGAIDNRTLAQNIAVVVQELPNDFNLCAFDVVALGLVPYSTLFSSLSSSQHDQIIEALHAVGMRDKSRQGYETLSGGEKQRVLIAKAIVQQPKLLIMDEPTSHLDIKYQLEIMQLTKSLDMTVLASFHDLNLASAMSDRLLLLHSGELVANGEPAEVITNDNIKAYFDVEANVVPHPTGEHPMVIYDYQRLAT